MDNYSEFIITGNENKFITFKKKHNRSSIKKYIDKIIINKNMLITSYNEIRNILSYIPRTLYIVDIEAYKYINNYLPKELTNIVASYLEYDKDNIYKNNEDRKFLKERLKYIDELEGCFNFVKITRGGSILPNDEDTDKHDTHLIGHIRMYYLENKILCSLCNKPKKGIHFIQPYIYKKYECEKTDNELYYNKKDNYSYPALKINEIKPIQYCRVYGTHHMTEYSAFNTFSSTSKNNSNNIIIAECKQCSKGNGIKKFIGYSLITHRTVKNKGITYNFNYLHHHAKYLAQDKYFKHGIDITY